VDASLVAAAVAAAAAASNRAPKRPWPRRFGGATPLKEMEVLFVCVHNSGRSIMAEALFNHQAQQMGLVVRAASAGTEAGASVNPMALEALNELGVTTSGLHPKQLTQEMVDRAKAVVSMGCGVDASACPARFLMTEDWGLEDPAGQPIEVVRRIRDDILERVNELLRRYDS
jgi:arsenate reductase